MPLHDEARSAISRRTGLSPESADPAAHARGTVWNSLRAWHVSRWVACLLVAVGVVCYVLRGVSRYQRPTFWAEDGEIFFTEVHKFGALDSILTPYAGYLHIIPRLIAIITLPVPLTWTPQAYDIAAVVVTLLAFALVLSPRLEWLLPSAPARAGTFFLLCVIPGYWEAYGNICNLIFIGGIALTLLALSDDPETRGGRVGEIAALVLLGFSGPVVALIVPLFVYRLWRCRSRQSLVALVVAVVAAVIQYTIFITSTRSTNDTGTVATVVRELLERVTGALLVGDSRTAAAWSTRHLAISASVWLLLLGLAALVALRSAAVVLGAMVVVTVVPVAYTDGWGGYWYPNLQRQFMVPRALLVILVVATVARLAHTMLERLRRRNATRRKHVIGVSLVLGALCLAACATGILRDFTIPSQPPTADTAAFLRCLETSHSLCSMAIAPKGWVVQLTPKDWP